MITERTLKRWRREALMEVRTLQTLNVRVNEPFTTVTNTWVELHQRILRMTQELMDLHLIKYERSKS